MRIRGYQLTKSEVEDVEFLELAEVNFKADSTELRKIAAFFLSAADSMDRMGDKYDHLHLADDFHEFETSPHLIVMKE